MSHLVNDIPRNISTESTDKDAEGYEFQRCSTPIDVLDDDSLLNIFCLYRPPLLDGKEIHAIRIIWGSKWNRERWWYKLTHICRRWRHLILGSASYLGLCLLCAPGTPIADMLARSPQFPIVIDIFHLDNGDRMNANDVEGIILALEHRDRVRRIRLWTPSSVTEKVIAHIDGEFPTLEYLCIAPMYRTDILFPETFQAPQLRHLISVNFACPMRSPLLSPTMGLVTLSLLNVPPPFFQPSELLHRVSLIPQLEILWIGWDVIYPRHWVDPHVDNATHISLPNLRFLQFRGFNAFLEALLSRITAPHLEVVRIAFWEERTFSVPCLLQFMSTLGDLRLGSATLSFDGNGATLSVYPYKTVKRSVFDMFIEGTPGSKVSNAAQVLNALSPLFSSVVDLTLDYEDNRFSPQMRNEDEPTDWRVILRSFNNVKNLFVAKGVVRKLSRSLRADDGESINNLLTELKELTYYRYDNPDAFTGFIDARQNAGHPVTLVHPKNTISIRRVFL